MQARPLNRNRQSIDVAQLDAALLRKRTVVDITGLSPSSIDRGRKSGTFPAPVRIGNDRCLRWRSGDIAAFCRAAGARGRAQ
jgi:predicted DNA-binding transcriptional regulator AlpA